MLPLIIEEGRILHEWRGMGVVTFLPRMVSTSKWLGLYAPARCFRKPALGTEYVEVLLVHGREFLDSI